MRRALHTLVRHDPLLLVTNPHGSHVEGFSEDDVEACVRTWSLDDEHLAAFLEGHLRMAIVSRHSPDPDRLGRALAALERAAPAFQDDQEFLELYADALGMLGDERYSAALDALLHKTPEEWRAHPLQDAMRHAVARSDWSRYDSLRERWVTLPKNAHICECATNYVANIDGLRALARGDQSGAVRFLRQAVSVNGCPHLNSGAGSVQLARELLARNAALAEVAEHVHAFGQFRVTEATTDLRRQVAERLG